MIRTMAAKMAGPFHLEQDIPCQDAFFVTSNEDGVYFAAVADGLGSQKFSQEGSSLASEVAVEFCKEQYFSGMDFSKVKSIMNNAYTHAYKAVVEEAMDSKRDVDQFDTTLCLAIYDKDHIFYGQSGDSGAVVLRKDGKYICLTEQQRDDEGGVYPLCSGPTKWEFGEMTDIAAIMLATDGVMDQVAPRILEKYVDDKAEAINVGFLENFLQRSEKRKKDIKQVEEKMFTYLENFPKEVLDDDKTVVVLYNLDVPTSRQPDEYYTPLDWDAIYEDVTRNMYPDDDDVDETKIVDDEVSDGEVTDLEEDKVEQDDKMEEPEATKEKEIMKDESADCEVCEIKLASQHLPKRPVKAKVKKRNMKKRNWSQYKDLLKGIGYVALGLFNFLAVKYFLDVVKHMFQGRDVDLFIASIIATYAFAAVSLVSYCVGNIGEFIGSTSEHSKELNQAFRRVFGKYPYLMVGVCSILPIPALDIVPIMAGWMKLNVFGFYLCTLFGKCVQALILFYIIVPVVF